MRAVFRRRDRPDDQAQAKYSYHCSTRYFGGNYRSWYSRNSSRYSAIVPPLAAARVHRAQSAEASSCSDAGVAGGYFFGVNSSR
uniref:Uncharacterized protein n=1 Tax=Tanacetum cinerariifolium TaxID=118510 RepID=A0A699XA93_TANCI|nr:hypothetical protein [Tanacetum cinerariifolium]